MKILFDQNTPRPLARFLTGHVVTRSVELGWEELRNGSLLDAAESNGFDVLVTADRNIRHQQNLEGREIALVVLPSGRWPMVRDRLAEVVSAVNHALPGQYRELPASKPGSPADPAL